MTVHNHIRYRLRTLIILLMIFAAPFTYAQTDPVSAAIAHLESGSTDKAKAVIDSAVAGAYSKDAKAWYVRGFVYKEIYNQKEKAVKGMEARKEAVRSFRKSMELDSAGEHLNDNRENLGYISRTYYNDAVVSLDSINYPKATVFFGLYKETSALRNDNAINIQKQSAEFNMALASVFEKIFRQEPEKNKTYYNQAKNIYLAVMNSDSNNARASYNIGILIYNASVEIINKMDYGTDIDSLNEILDTCKVLFREALPYMEKAYRFDPRRMETLKGLAGIYYSLYDYDKYISILSEMGAVQSAAGDHKEYIETLNLILGAYSMNNNIPQYKNTLVKLADAYLKINDMEKHNAAKKKIEEVELYLNENK